MQRIVDSDDEKQDEELSHAVDSEVRHLDPPPIYEQSDEEDSSVDTISLSEDDWPDELTEHTHDSLCTSAGCPLKNNGRHKFAVDDPPVQDNRWELDYSWDTVKLGHPTIPDTDFPACARRWVSDEYIDKVTYHYSYFRDML